MRSTLCKVVGFSFPLFLYLLPLAIVSTSLCFLVIRGMIYLMNYCSYIITHFIEKVNKNNHFFEILPIAQFLIIIFVRFVRRYHYDFLGKIL